MSKFTLFKSAAKIIGAGLSTTGLAGAGRKFGTLPLNNNKLSELFKNEELYDLIAFSIFLYLLLKNTNIFLFFVTLLFCEFLGMTQFSFQKQMIYTLISIKFIVSAYTSFSAPELFILENLYAGNSIGAIFLLALKPQNRSFMILANTVLGNFGFSFLNNSTLAMYGYLSSKVAMLSGKTVVGAATAFGGPTTVYLLMKNERDSKKAQVEAASSSSINVRDDMTMVHESARLGFITKAEASASIKKGFSKLDANQEIIDNASGPAAQTIHSIADIITKA